VTGQRADATAHPSRPGVWLVGLGPALAREAGRALAAEGLVVRRGRLPRRRDTPDVVVGAARGGTPTEQRMATRAALAAAAPWRLVMLTDLERPSALRQLIGAGAHGLVLVDELSRALAATVRAVAAGQVCTPERARAAVTQRPLSARERQILAMVIMGLTNGEISQRLHLAESTVKSHLASTFEKLGVQSRAEAAALVTEPQQMLSTGVVVLGAGAPE
jgi:DNA-binding NarL/FixJ family response regulator